MDLVTQGSNVPLTFPVLVYHKVDPRFEFSIARISPNRFKSHLDWLLRQGYQTITISEAARLVRENQLVPDKTVAIVFDDGFDGIYKYAWPLLRERKMTATVFMVAGFAGKQDEWDVKIGWRRFRHLSWDQLRELSEAGIEIGSHSLNHPDLTRLENDALQYELRESRSILKEKVGCDIRAFSVPFGTSSPLVSDSVMDNGYESMVVVRSGPYEKTNSGMITFAGVCVYLTTGYNRLEGALQGRPPSLLGRMVQKAIGQCARWTPLVKGRPTYP
ncbi:MAG: polysaccharide deacetylase family protein [Candidatus Latescibacteria bacterium]|nr:polysaccharide deacetylase family protein [Candidatus Latescibacterota bacterium]